MLLEAPVDRGSVGRERTQNLQKSRPFLLFLMLDVPSSEDLRSHSVEVVRVVASLDKLFLHEAYVLDRDLKVGCASQHSEMLCAAYMQLQAAIFLLRHFARTF